MQQLSKQPAFELGQIVATPGALTALEVAGQLPQEFLSRHVSREWGDLSEEDRKENDYSLEHGFRLLSSYQTNAGDIVLDWSSRESLRIRRAVPFLCVFIGECVGMASDAHWDCAQFCAYHQFLQSVGRTAIAVWISFTCSNP